MLQIVGRNALLGASACAGPGAGHAAAVLCAFPANPGTFFHPFYPLAALGAGFADLGANPANLAGESGTAKHEVGGGLAHLRASYHEPKMIRRNMLSS